jgi:four helix bundle protein
MPRSFPARQSASGEIPFDIRERTFQFAPNIVNFCLELERQPGVNWAVSKQLLRSGTSIGANVEEGQAGQSKADFISKYSIARKETRETNYWLRLISATGLSKNPEIGSLLDETNQLTKILTTIIKNAQKY